MKRERSRWGSFSHLPRAIIHPRIGCLGSSSAPESSSKPEVVLSFFCSRCRRRSCSLWDREDCPWSGLWWRSSTPSSGKVSGSEIAYGLTTSLSLPSLPLSLSLEASLNEPGGAAAGEGGAGTVWVCAGFIVLCRYYLSTLFQIIYPQVRRRRMRGVERYGVEWLSSLVPLKSKTGK